MTPKEKARAIRSVSQGVNTSMEALERLAANSSTVAAVLRLCRHATPDAEMAEILAQSFVAMYAAGMNAGFELAFDAERKAAQ